MGTRRHTQNKWACFIITKTGLGIFHYAMCAGGLRISFSRIHQTCCKIHDKNFILLRHFSIHVHLHAITLRQKRQYSWASLLCPPPAHPCWRRACLCSNLHVLLSWLRAQVITAATTHCNHQRTLWLHLSSCESLVNGVTTHIRLDHSQTQHKQAHIHTLYYQCYRRLLA